MPSRGEVYWFNLPTSTDDPSDEVVGHEQARRRPGIILQNDSDNRQANTTIIVPTTTGSVDEAEDLSQIFIPAGDGVREDSIALCRQLRVIDMDVRMGDCLGELSQQKLREIENAVLVTLSL